MDNSDGLLPTLAQLAEANSCRINLLTETLSVEGAEKLGINPNRLWLGWGDWNVIAAISEEKFALASKIAAEMKFPLRHIGVFEIGAPEVVLTTTGATLRAPRLESERFAKDSWFTAGINRYVELLKDVNVG